MDLFKYNYYFMVAERTGIYKQAIDKQAQWAINPELFSVSAMCKP